MVLQFDCVISGPPTPKIQTNYTQTSVDINRWINSTDSTSEGRNGMVLLPGNFMFKQTDYTLLDPYSTFNMGYAYHASTEDNPLLHVRLGMTSVTWMNATTEIYEIVLIQGRRERQRRVIDNSILEFYNCRDYGFILYKNRTLYSIGQSVMV
jgi:hypothetical protein